MSHDQVSSTTPERKVLMHVKSVEAQRPPVGMRGYEGGGNARSILFSPTDCDSRLRGPSPIPLVLLRRAKQIKIRSCHLQA
ncbi:hypothetical protein TNCV_27571 [Trichonephila clavipes]|uniref:Uncharacterized protein n=1 Tax=Trichonephila clavipes TaxID=2585209 RepID=A0A8X6WL84_TRICX|nr:hypothetical protein TNCV_27571 [Trichonephila clavipes]